VLASVDARPAEPTTRPRELATAGAR
jgi:hypothetical protein